MVTIERGKGSGTLIDKLYTAFVSIIQSTVVKAIVRWHARKHLYLTTARDETFQARIRELGLAPERLWWGPMTIFPEKIDYLIKEIESRPPKRLLEVGSGTSTAVFAALGEKYGFDVLSLENHQDTIDYVQFLLKDLPCSRRVVIQKCGFVRRKFPNGDVYRWYDADLGRPAGKFDFVLIDGPMGTLVGRNGALPEILPFLETEHRIYFDDSQRPHESSCIDQWRDQYHGLVVQDVADVFGLAKIAAPIVAGTRAR